MSLKNKQYKTEVTEQDIEKICESLVKYENYYGWTYSNILRDTGIDIKIIKDIERQKKYENISKKYNIDAERYSKNLTVNEIKSLCFHFEMEPIFTDSVECRRENCIEGLKDAAFIKNPTEDQIREALLILYKDIYPDITDNFDYKYDPVWKKK